MPARSQRIRRIAINTGGGDAPGLNAVIRSVTLCAHNRGWECVGIRDGYDGILHADRYPQGGLVPLTPERVRGITHLGGTIIGTTNVGNPLSWSVIDPGRWWRPSAPTASTRSSAWEATGPSRSQACSQGRGCAWWASPRPSTTTWTEPW